MTPAVVTLLSESASASEMLRSRPPARATRRAVPTVLPVPRHAAPNAKRKKLGRLDDDTLPSIDEMGWRGIDSVDGGGGDDTG